MGQSVSAIKQILAHGPEPLAVYPLLIGTLRLKAKRRRFGFSRGVAYRLGGADGLRFRW
jgi:hypothetical protein